MWNIDNRLVKGVPQIATLSWTPGVLLGDGSTGNLEFTATDTEGATDGPRTVTLGVVPNNVPTNLGGGPVSILENNPGVDIIVSGDDLDPYDKSVLSIMVTTLPTLGIFTLNGTNVQQNRWIQSSFRSNSDGQNTTYTFHYVPTPYVFGSDSFSIKLEDQLGAVSTVFTVTIVVSFSDTPPSSNNLTVTGYVLHTVLLTLPGPVDPDVGDTTTLHIVPPISSDFNYTTLEFNTTTNTYTKIGGSPWSFTFESDVVVTSSFQFYITDSHSESSPIYYVTVIITEDPSLLPPIAEDGYWNVSQGVTLDFDFMSLVDNRDKKQIILVQIMDNINSTIPFGPDPNLGTLRGANGIPFGSAATSPYLNPVNSFPVPFLTHFAAVNSGVATFSYRVCDASLLYSNVATITIDILHINFPPVITVKPTSTLIEPRGDSGKFTIIVSDSDSPQVTLYIKTDSVDVLPLDYCTVGFAPSNGLTKPLTNDPNYVALVTQSPPIEAGISYMPFYTMPDSVIGTFVLQACDNEGACSTEETRSVGVTPNNQPHVYGNNYNFINKEGEMLNITLTGDDPDFYHTTELTFVILSTTKNGPLYLLAPNGTVVQTILEANLPLTVMGEPDYVNNRTTLVVSYSPLEFYLSVDPKTGVDIPDSFRFYVVDLLGSASSTQRVSINTNESVPHPPTSVNTTLRVKEHDCLVDSCGTPINNPPFVQIPVIALDATDTSNYSLSFIMTEPLRGQLFITNSNGTFDPVLMNTSISRPWRFYYQPPSEEIGIDPVLISILPFVITVDASVTPEYYLSIYVDPVNDPPVGADVVFSSPMNVPGNVTLAHSDPDDPVSALVLYVVSIPTTNKATFTSLDGTPVALNTHISSWTLQATPYQDVYSSTNTTPIAQIQYQIVDHYDVGTDKKSSNVYTVSYIVDFVYYPIHYAPNPSTTMAEDTTCLITLDNNGPAGWFGGNKEYQHVSITLINFHSDNKPGNYSICDSLSQCRQVTEGDLPVDVPSGSHVKFAPGPNDNGQNYSRFDFLVIPETPVDTLTVTWTINVTPVNDPPVTIPINYIPSNALNGYRANRCDENTTFIAAFYATDIDSPLSSLVSQWLTLLDDMPYSFYDCANISLGHPSVRNSSCAQGVTMDVSLPEIPLHGLANWKVILIPHLGYYTSFKSVDFSVYTLDDYKAPSVPVKATINVDPINSAPYFVPLDGDSIFDQNPQGAYILIRGWVKDPDFQRGFPIELIVTTQVGTLGLPLMQSKCVLKNNNQTLICLDLIEKINAFFYQKNPSGIPFYPPSLDISLSATINFLVNDLGNIDKHHPPNNLSCNSSAIVTQLVAITAAAAKGGNSAVTSIAAGVGVALAVGIGVAAALLFKSSKAATDLYLAEFVSNLDSAGNMYNPLYTEATKKAVNPFYAGAGGATG